jgi:hypothetical protein
MNRLRIFSKHTLPNSEPKRRVLPEEHRDLIRRQAILRYARQRADKGLPAITMDHRQLKRKWNADYRERLKLGLVEKGKPGVKPRKKKE